MQSNPQPEQITKTVVGMSTIFIGGIALLSSVFVVPAGEVGVVTTLGKVSNTPREPGLNLKLPFIQSTHNFSVRTQVIPCLLYTSPSPRDGLLSRMPSSA